MGNAPKIRFKGYTDVWEQRKLSDEFSDFIVPMRDKPKEFGGNIPWTRIEDIEGKYLNGTLSDQYVTEETVQKMNLKIIPKDSLIVSSSATFGVVAVVTQDLITNQTFIGLVPNEKETLNYWYAYFYSDEARKYMKLQSAGSTIFYIARESFENMPIDVPSKEEMMKIGTYFDNLDNLITLHQRKCDDTKQLKKYMLQKMFPKKGESVPEIRFDGFTDAWEQRKLSDLIIEYKETVDSDCTLPVLTSSKTEGVVLQEEHFGRVQNHDITGYNILPRNYCTYRNRSDGVDFTFNINRCCDKGIISKFYPVFCGNNSDIFFISMVLNYCDEVVHEIAYTCTGTGQKVLSFLDLQKMNIRVPSYDEQKKISQYFEQLDNLITLHQRKADSLKEFKKYMLQNMFV